MNKKLIILSSVILSFETILIFLVLNSFSMIPAGEGTAETIGRMLEFLTWAFFLGLSGLILLFVGILLPPKIIIENE